MRGETCAKVARTLGLGPHLILSDSEDGSGGRAKSTILADAMEALLGAIFLDAGFDAARGERAAPVGEPVRGAADTTARPDAKSALQEWAQGQGLALPQYVEIARKGPDHAPRFTSEVRITGKAPARGEGASKRSAEQAAARALAGTRGCAGRRMMNGRSGRDEAAPDRSAQRCGFIAVIGAPNAGKSTLVNALVGAKVSIVSHKVQTTRVPVRGIAIEGDSQLVFIDTPGLFAPRRRLDQAMVEAAWGGARDADLVVLMIDAAKGLDEDVERILARLKDVRLPLLAVLNKVDRVPPRRSCWRLPSELEQHASFQGHSHDLGAVRRRRRRPEARPRRARAGRTLALSRRGSLRCAAADARRRDHAREDLQPPARRAALRHDGRDDGLAGAQGRLGAHRADDLRDTRTGKRPSCSARAATRSSRSRRRRGVELAQILERRVHLFLFVKVREGWQDDPERYREMGLELPQEMTLRFGDAVVG